MPRRKRESYPAWLLAQDAKSPGTIRFHDDPQASACLEARRLYEKKFKVFCALTQEELIPLIDAKTLRTVLSRMRKANLEKHPS